MTLVLFLRIVFEEANKRVFKVVIPLYSWCFAFACEIKGRSSY